LAPPILPADDFQSVLDRPADQRRREFQYRFAQSAVFGLPVVALQCYGRSLGGPESDRWIAILQALLAGWVVYVGAAGMLFEGVLLLSRPRLSPDLLPAVIAVALYLASLLRGVVHLVAPGGGPFPRLYFHWTVAVLTCWTGVRWWQLRRARAGTSGDDSDRPKGPGVPDAGH